MRTWFGRTEPLLSPFHKVQVRGVGSKTFDAPAIARPPSPNLGQALRLSDRHRRAKGREEGGGVKMVDAVAIATRGIVKHQASTREGN
jgi:hypothetical protein